LNWPHKNQKNYIDASCSYTTCQNLNIFSCKLKYKEIGIIVDTLCDNLTHHVTTRCISMVVITNYMVDFDSFLYLRYNVGFFGGWVCNWGSIYTYEFVCHKS
jgi:hypothetical protein